MFTISKHNLIYNGEFYGIDSHDMPTIGDDDLVRTLTGDIVFSLKPPRTKRQMGRPRKKTHRVPIPRQADYVLF